jgi:hypothetical protein
MYRPYVGNRFCGRCDCWVPRAEIVDEVFCPVCHQATRDRPRNRKKYRGDED